MHKPDYNGGSILNLMASIIAARGGKREYKELSSLRAKELKDADNLVLLVIDGMGYEWLRKHGKGSFLASQVRAQLTSVFPATTSAAMTAIYTGVPAKKHGLTCWHMLFKECGMVLAALPPHTRSWQLDLEHMKPRQVVPVTSVFEKIDMPSFQIQPKEFKDSAYNKRVSAGAKILTYTKLGGMFRKIKKAMKQPGKKFVLAYWPELDLILHHAGTKSAEAQQHFKVLDKKLARFVKKVNNATLVITADHGLHDVSRNVWVHKHPVMEEAMSLPLCGEGRLAYAYVHPEKAKKFESYVKRKLKHACTIHKSKDLLSWYGPGKAHPHLQHRIGDYVLIAKPGWAIKDRVWGEGGSMSTARHAGVSKEEMHVPLIVIEK